MGLIYLTIDEGPFQIGMFKEILAECEKAFKLVCADVVVNIVTPSLDEVQNAQVYSDLSPKEKDRNQVTVQDGRVVLQNVQGQQNRGQGNNAHGVGATSYGGGHNRVRNSNSVQARHIKIYNYNADDCDIFDSNVDEAPTAQTMLMANLSSTYPVYGKAGPSYDSDILYEVHDHGHYQDTVYEHNKVHEMHDDVQPNYAINSHADYTNNSNTIMYYQYVKDNAMPVVQSSVSSIQNDPYMMILNDMHEQPAQHESVIAQNNVVDNSLSAKRATSKEQVELLIISLHSGLINPLHSGSINPLHSGLINTPHSGLVSSDKVADENVPAPALTRSDDQILPFVAWVFIGKTNFVLDLHKSQKNLIFHIFVDILHNTNFFKAFTASASLGYNVVIHFVSRMEVNNLHHPCRAILSMINQCLTDKKSRHDRPRYLVFICFGANLGSPTKKGRKDKPHVIPYCEFMKIISCHLGRIHNIHQRSESLFNLTKEDFRLERKRLECKQPKPKPGIEKSSKLAPALKSKETKERPSKASTTKPPKLKPAKEKSTKTTPPQKAGKGKITKVRKVKSPF
nr:hypothetical protein [Tanacetum cinerariifolium]